MHGETVKKVTPQFKEFSGTRKIFQLIMVSDPKLLELTLYNHNLLP